MRCSPPFAPTPTTTESSEPTVPELPEVQAHAERLTEQFAGRVLHRFAPITFTALKTVSPPPDGAYGTALQRVDHRG